MMLLLYSTMCSVLEMRAALLTVVIQGMELIQAAVPLLLFSVKVNHIGHVFGLVLKGYVGWNSYTLSW